MKVPFVRHDETITVALTPAERAVLRMLPGRLERLGDRRTDPAAARLDPDAYRDDPEASGEFRAMVAADLAGAREHDRARFMATIDDGSLDDDDAERWARVIGEARLALAARLGITDDGWEDDPALSSSAEGALLHYLGYVQDALVRVLAVET